MSTKIVILIWILILPVGIVFCEEEKMPNNLMPMPEQIEKQPGQFRITESFRLKITNTKTDRIEKYARRILRRLAGRTGLFFQNGGLAAKTDADSISFAIDCAREGLVRLREDESYSLSVSPEKIVLKATTDIGAMRGLETFLQLLAADKSGYYFPAVKIEDKPRFPWRGLLIDVCRHFLPVEVIKRNLDGMAAVKLNVLHLHLTEDQGFRIESKAFPKLHQMGSDGEYFTQEQMREIIAYAGARGIRVAPEFDMPGHVTSWLAGHPELASLPGPYTIERGYGVKDPSLDPTKESTYEFLDTFLGEMAALFPDEYLHIGGDENNGKHWDQSESIQAFKQANNLKDNHELQTYFNKRILKILTEHGKKMVGWDEILQPGMPNNIVIQSWRGKEALVHSAQQGYMGILSNGYYIDLMQPTDFHYLNNPLPEESPLADVQKKNILGGEAAMWSELVTVENVDSRIWPRTAAIAERFWSPGSVNDVDDMYRRLETISLQLEELGLAHEKNYEMMLRRLAKSSHIAPLKTLVDVLEPVKIYRRHEYRTYTIFSPMTRVVDVARPDAKAARAFRKAVDRFLADRSDKHTQIDLELMLERWETNHQRLEISMMESPALQEIAPHSEALAAISKIGLQALAYLAKDELAPKTWFENSLQAIEQAKAPHGETELMVVTAIEKLVRAAANE